MPGSGTILDSTIIPLRSIDIPQTIPAAAAAATTTTTTARNSLGMTTTSTTVLDDREIFKALHDCMKDVGKFRQYIYYLGTSCDITKLRNKIQKIKDRINHSFYHQQELIRKSASGIGSIKSELVIRRFEKCLCFTLASLNYYENLLHKYSILLVYFPLATADRTNVVSLGFEDSTINADEISFENQEAEENETNRYIELLNQIQFVQSLREEIEQIDVYQLRHHATSYSKDFVDNMHKYTNEFGSENNASSHSGRDRYTIRDYCTYESTSFIARCHRRKFLCISSIVISILIMIGIILGISIATRRSSIG